MEVTDPMELSKKYKEDAIYFSNLLEGSRQYIQAKHAAKFETLIIAYINTSNAYAVYAIAITHEEVTAARCDVNKYAMEIQAARAAFAAIE